MMNEDKLNQEAIELTEEQEETVAGGADEFHTKAPRGLQPDEFHTKAPRRIQADEFHTKAPRGL